jgi:SNF2 family DNA or RNA helicase
MSDPGPCVLVGTGDAWGEGVNLQDTDTFLIAMLPFTPGQVVQWEGRVARHGQKRPVLIEYMVAENTVDEHVAAILLDKLPAVEEVAKDDSVVGFADSLMGGDKTEEEIIESVLAMLEVA